LCLSSFTPEATLAPLHSTKIPIKTAFCIEEEEPGARRFGYLNGTTHMTLCVQQSKMANRPVVPAFLGLSGSFFSM
jgi:hypothetical protein